MATQADAARRPVGREVLVQRLTALGMTMAPNRPAAEATMWVHELVRLLGDIAEDVILSAIDEMQKRSRFLPTVSEIRDIADPIMARREREFRRLDAMRRYLDSGQPIPVLAPPKRPLMDRRGEIMTEAECAELNQILEKLDAVSRYNPDGSRYEVARRKARPVRREQPQMPTRQDYIDMGVDPAVLDRIERTG